MKLIIGLGNPGKKYHETKHNIGFMCLDEYATQKNYVFKKDNKFQAEIVKNGNVILLKPHTFMNLSGQSLRACMDYYNVDIEDVLVIYDDLDLPLGKLRLREKGSAGGHNGIKNIISHIGTQDFYRVRVGIDSNKMIDTKDYVLGKFSKDEKIELETKIRVVVDVINDFINDLDFKLIMNKYN